VFLWNCVTLEKIPAITHDEFITAMCFNSTGEHLATYGHQTTKIWDITTRKELYTIKNLPESRALSIVFSDGDTKLVVGLDSRKVAVASYRESLTWSLINSGFLQEVEAGAYVNTPTTIPFNTDATMVAVGYRGSALEVWDMVELVRVNACKRRLTYDVGPKSDWTGVMRTVWHPSGESLLGIYTDGTVFKWNPFEEFDHQELEADIYYCPSEVQCSPDGVLFLLSDQEGSVRLYNYENFSLLYKLFTEDVIIDLCFSMDSRRFYDLRGSYCNIWEPSVLFRLPYSDYCNSESNPESISTVISNHASEAFVDARVQITALAARPLGGLFWYGNEDGLVEVNNASTLKSQKVGNTKRGGAVEFLIWSEDGNYIAYSDNVVYQSAANISQPRTFSRCHNLYISQFNHNSLNQLNSIEIY
jgi:WD40 repeat protein